MEGCDITHVFYLLPWHHVVTYTFDQTWLHNCKRVVVVDGFVLNGRHPIVFVCY